MSDDPRNVVLVTIDSLRADRCGHLGGESRTPTIDYLAEEGLAFDHAVAPGPTTSDSMSVAHTGAFPAAMDDADPPTKQRLRRHMASRRTLAERFSERGYSTAAFSANPWTSRHFGFDKGFDRFEDFMEADASSSIIVDALDGVDLPGSHAVQMALNWAQGQNMFMSWRRFFDDIREWLHGADEPYFLWVFLVDCHMPYQPSAANRTGSRLGNLAANAWLYGGTDGRGEAALRPRLVRAYDEAVRDTDDFVAALRGNLGSDTLLAVHADHGELFGEDDLYGHGSNLREELVHVPFVVANGPTGRIEEPFSLRRLPELLPRLAAGGGVEAARDLTRPQVRTRNYDPQFGVRGDDWTYVLTEDDELLYRRNGGSAEDDAERTAVGRPIVERWRNGIAERERLVAAATDAATDGTL